MWLRSICLCLALVLTPAPAWSATGTPDPSLRYRVVEVAVDDRLNVREQAGVDADVIGALAPDADDLVVTGAVMEVGGSDWWEVVFVEGYLDRGWVNATYLAPVDGAAREEDYPLQCGGTEPFWSLDIGDGSATYSAVDEETLSMSASDWRVASGRYGIFAVQLERDGRLGYASVWRERAHCSDGMSDIGYPFGTILIRPDGEVLAGCCRRAR